MKRVVALVAFLVCSVAAAFAADPLNGQAAIRVTLVQGTAVTSADAIGSTLFLEPYKGEQVSVYDGVSTWTPLTIPPSTVSLPATGLAANSNFDVYLTTCSGSPCMVWSAAWVDDTTPPARSLQDGVFVATADRTKRLIGSVRTTTVAGQLADSHTLRFVSNLYNDEPRDMHAEDPTSTWTYSNNVVMQQAHANPDNKLDYIVVVPRLVWAYVRGTVISSVPANAVVGIALDNSIGNIAQDYEHASVPASLTSNSFNTNASYAGTPGIGHHTVLWMERGFGSGTQTWLGSVPPWVVNGIMGEVSN